MISYLDFVPHLPPGTFDSPTPAQLFFNFALLHPSAPSDSLIHGLAKFLESLSELNDERNANRPPDSEPLDLCVKSQVGTPATPRLRYTITFPVDVKSFVEIVADPTEYQGGIDV